MATFEDLGLPPNSYDNNAGASGQFVDDGDSFNNSYSSDYGGIWSGWAISSTTDTTTAGYTNQYSAITGSGADGSQTYAVAFTFDSAANPFHPADSFVNLASGTTPVSIQVTNTTYAYLSMLDGDSFENAFSSGDYFLLTITGYTGQEGTGTEVGEVDFYLANFLGSNAYIVNSWQTLNLTSLAGSESLQFGLESSQNDPTYGMNTPAYFAADNLTVAANAANAGSISGVVFNDLNDDGVQDNGEGGLGNWAVQLYSGSTVVATSTTDSNGNYSFTDVPAGTYTVQEVPQSGYTQTAPAAPGTYTVTVTAGDNVTGEDFGDILPTLTSISVTPVDPSLAKGFTEQFVATGTYSDQSTENVTNEVTWSSGTSAVASISSTGLATGASEGTSTITATLDGINGSTDLTVTAPVLTSIRVTPANPSVADGLTEPFTATGTYSDDSTQDLTSDVTWSSVTSTVASISAAGLATGLATGTSTISASLDDVSGSTLLTVTAPVLTSIAVSPSNPSVADGLTEQFTATGTYSDNSTADITSLVTWASTLPTVATINTAGLATGLTTGTSTITASLDGVSDSTLLTVTAPVLVSIAVTPSDANLAKGLTQQFTATGTYSNNSAEDLTSKVTWSSTTPTVASISTAGLAIGVATGTSTITATLDGMSGATVLTVTAPVLTSIAVSPANPSVAAGLTEQFTATGTYSDNSTADITSLVTWASSLPAFATISTAGLATGVATGASTITAALDGLGDSAVLTVTAPLLVSIAVSPSNSNLVQGLTQQFTATGTYSNNSTQDLTAQVTWSSGSPSVATLSSSGLATGAAVGTSTITATLNGVGGSTVLTVSPVTLVAITVSPANPNLAEGLTEPFTATGTYSDDSTQDLTSQVTWASGTPSVATMSSSGVALGDVMGTSTITATLNGVSGSTVLTVTAPTLVAIAVTPSNSSLAKGLSAPFTATGTYSNNATQNVTLQVTWSSSDPTVATVSGSGSATGAAEGTATVSASLDGVTGSTALTVTAPILVSISVTPSGPSVAEGLTEQFTATGTYSDHSTQDVTNEVTWSASRPSNVTINTAGLSTGVGIGSSAIFASWDGVTGATVLAVTAPLLVSISITPLNPGVVAGSTAQFTALGTYTDHSTQNVTNQVIWTSSAPAVAPISSLGLATGAAVGTSTISAMLDGKSGSTMLTVTTPLPVQTSPVTLTSFRVEMVTIGARPHARRVTALVAQFSGGLSATAAQNLAAYTAFSARVERVRRSVQIVYNKPVPLSQAIYNASVNSVILVPQGRPALRRLEQLRVNVAVLTDPQGRSINNGRNFEATVTTKGLVVSSSTVAVDALLAKGRAGTVTGG